jgi:hypothetical protein
MWAGETEVKIAAVESTGLPQSVDILTPASVHLCAFSGNCYTMLYMVDKHPLFTMRITPERRVLLDKIKVRYSVGSDLDAVDFALDQMASDKLIQPVEDTYEARVSYEVHVLAAKEEAQRRWQQYKEETQTPLERFDDMGL